MHRDKKYCSLHEKHIDVSLFELWKKELHQRLDKSFVAV